ncbi:MAG: 4Fe-4S binding protein, partial [Spirochaetales bacterium]|nr:4Fe-4S binding protein [Spirochaetales bacterium]
ANPVLREMIGILFSWKTCLLLIVLISSTMIHRPFCKYLCPLGALYGLFSRFSLYQMHLDKSKCIGCGKCEKACPMDVRCTEDINTAECIRCGKCKAACPVHAIDSTFGFDLKKKLEKADGTDIKGN